MSEINIVIAVITILMGGGGLGALYASRVNAKRFRSQSETEARAGFTAEFEAFAKAQGDQIREQKDEIATLKTDMAAQMATLRAETKAEVDQIRAEHRNAEDYIDVLIIGISDGTIPPIPHRAPLALPRILPTPPNVPPNPPET